MPSHAGPHALAWLPWSECCGRLDLSVNMLSYSMCKELQLVAPSELKLILKGNRVLDEVGVPPDTPRPRAAGTPSQATPPHPIHPCQLTHPFGASRHVPDTVDSLRATRAL